MAGLFTPLYPTQIFDNIEFRNMQIQKIDGNFDKESKVICESESAERFSAKQVL